MGAYLNTIGALTYTAAIVKTVRDEYVGRKRNKTVMAMTARIENAYQAAISLWRQPKDKEIVKLASIILEMKTNAIDNENHPSAYTQYSMALLDDLLGYIKDKDRRRAIEKLYDAVSAMHRYFDRKLSRNAEADIAIDAVDEWMRLAAQA